MGFLGEKGRFVDEWSYWQWGYPSALAPPSCQWEVCKTLIVGVGGVEYNLKSTSLQRRQGEIIKVLAAGENKMKTIPREDICLIKI